MITISKRLGERRPADVRLVLPFERRSRSRLRVRLENGEEAGVFMERGEVLRGGDLLLADDGRVIEVVAAEEVLSKVESTDPWQLTRVSYHLGNRHVPVQIGAGWLRYPHDHVLDDMVRALGSSVTLEKAPFEPEAGGHGGAAYSHGHGHR